MNNQNTRTNNMQNPFPGIRSYEQHEAHLFFGREKHIQELLQRIEQTHFIAIVGSSGCGKSSLIKAGLIPTLINGKSHIEGKWTHALFRPGDNPIRNFAESVQASLISNKEENVLTIEHIEKILREDENGIIELVKTINKNSNVNRLFVIDQFEEIVRFKQKDSNKDAVSESRHFINLMLTAMKAKDQPIFLVMTMRSDFIDYCTDFQGLPEAINLGYYLVPRMTDTEKIRVIEGPSEVYGAKISKQLINRLLADIGDAPEQMPILQHALMRTWDYWTMNSTGKQEIDVAHYEAIGTIKNALSIHAEEVFNELPTNRLRSITERIFKALTEIGTDGRGTRHPTMLKELVKLSGTNQDDVIEVIERFRKPGRAFLMPPSKNSLAPETVIDISHESIMRIWSRLRDWVSEETKSAKLYLRLTRSAALYQQGKAGLWINPELQLGLNWYKDSKPNAAWAQRYDPSYERAIEFLETSRKAYEEDIENKENRQRKRLERARTFAALMSVVSLIAVLSFIVSLNLKFQAEESESKAKEKEQIAIVERRNAEEQRKEALTQKKIAEQQQQIAEQQKIITEQQRQEAILQKNNANVARNVAVVAKNEAEVQRQEAVSQKQIAEEQRVKAEISEENAQRLRLLALARSVALQSAKMKSATEGELPALLAKQAYNLTLANDGNINDPAIFNAVSVVSNNEKIYRGHDDAIRSIALDGNTLYSGDNLGCIKVWDVKKDKLNNTIYIDGKILHPIRDIDTKSGIVVASCSDGNIYIKKGKDESLMKAHSSSVPAIVILPDSKSIASGDINGNIVFHNIKSRTVIDSVSIGAPISEMIVDDSGNLFIASINGAILTYSSSKKPDKANKLFETNHETSTIAVFDDYLATGYKDGVIEIWEKSSSGRYESRGKLIGHSSTISDLCFSPDGKTLSSASYDNYIRLWDYMEQSDQPIAMKNHDSWVYSIAFTKDSDCLISAGADKAIVKKMVNPALIAESICDKITRNLSKEEWNKYIGNDIEYEKTCSGIK